MKKKLGLSLEQYLLENVGFSSYSLFFNSYEAENFQLISTNSNIFSEKESYRVYEIPVLLRTLLDQSGTLSSQVQSEYFQSNDEFCFLLEWTDQSRIIFVFHGIQPDLIDGEKVISFFKNKTDDLKSYFQMFFFEQKLNKKISNAF